MLFEIVNMTLPNTPHHVVWCGKPKWRTIMEHDNFKGFVPAADASNDVVRQVAKGFVLDFKENYTTKKGVAHGDTVFLGIARANENRQVFETPNEALAALVASKAKVKVYADRQYTTPAAAAKLDIQPFCYKQPGHGFGKVQFMTLATVEAYNAAQARGSATPTAKAPAAKPSKADNGKRPLF